MIISQKIEFITKNFSFSIEKLKNVKTNKEKRNILNELIGNILNAGIIISTRILSKIVSASRTLVQDVIKNFYNPKVLEKVETRGRKNVEEKYPKIINQIKDICNRFEVVDESMQDKIVYVNLTLRKIKAKLISNYDYSEETCPCINTIRKIMVKVLNYKMTKVKKKKVFKKIPETDAIFANIDKKLVEAENSHILPFSIDDKTAKYIGNLSGGGYSWFKREALDHDTLPDYILKPFGILNMKTKQAEVYCTTSNSTADFKVDCIDEYLNKHLTPNIKKVMLFLDNGPENNSRRKLWMKRIIELSIKYNIRIELVYYPPYHSKYNKIEHYWGVLQRSWSGLILDTLEKAIGAINGTTWDGVPSIGHLRTNEYLKGVKVDEQELLELIKKHVHYENKGIEKWSLLTTP